MRAGALAACLVLAGPAGATGGMPLADVHVHYKATQAEVTSAGEAVAALVRNGVRIAVVMGTPPELALDLEGGRALTLVPFYSPYREPGDWARWAQDASLPGRLRAALTEGRYRGIGELHFIPGFVPRWDTPVIAGVMALAAEFDVPVLVHTEFSRADYLLGLCRAHPEVRMLWAHAGGILPVQEVARVLSSCPRVAIELSARDPWRYVSSPITDESGRLLPAWRALVEEYFERIMVGSDPVWPVDRMDAWDEPDTGWREIDRFLAFHRAWLADLPAEIRQAIAHGNARRWLGLAP